MRRSWTLGGSVAGLAIVASATLGVGTAAADAPCTRALLPLLPATQRAACELLLDGGSSSSGSGSSSSTPTSPRSAGPVSRVVQGAADDVGGTVGTVTRRPAASTPTRASGSSSSTRTNTTSSGSSARAVTPSPAAAAPITAAPVAAAPDAGTLLSSSYDRVPTSLLGTSPAGGAGASLVAPASYDPGLLLPGTPARTLTPAGATDGVTTTSSAGPVGTPDAGSRLGTPLLLGVLAGSTVIALAVRSSVLRRSRRRTA